MDDWFDLQEKTAEMAAEFTSRPPVLNGPKRQHFVPRFYLLEGFSRAGSLAVYDRKLDEVRLQKPEATAVIGHFYTAEDDQGRKRYELEQTLSEIESKAAPLIKELAAKGSLTPEERSDMAIFVAMALCRTPDLIESLKLVNGHMVKKMAQAAFGRYEIAKESLRHGPNAPATEEALETEARFMAEFIQSDQYQVETNHQWALGMSMDLFAVIAPIIVERRWLVLHRDSDKRSFITSDAPLILTTTGPRKKGAFTQGIGFANTDALVVFPLTASSVLLIFGSGGSLQHKISDSIGIRNINLMIADHCQRFVIGRDEMLVRSLVDRLNLADKAWQPKIQAG